MSQLDRSEILKIVGILLLLIAYGIMFPEIIEQALTYVKIFSQFS